MAWVDIMCPDGPYQLDPEGVTQRPRSHAYAKAVNDCSSLDTETEWCALDLI